MFKIKKMTPNPEQFGSYYKNNEEQFKQPLDLNSNGFSSQLEQDKLNDFMNQNLNKFNYQDNMTQSWDIANIWSTNNVSDRHNFFDKENSKLTKIQFESMKNAFFDNFKMYLNDQNFAQLNEKDSKSILHIVNALVESLLKENKFNPNNQIFNILKNDNDGTYDVLKQSLTTKIQSLPDNHPAKTLDI